jgi:chromosome segregation ATPase
MGFRAQATSGDARAERLVRAVRMEVADLKQAMGSWSETRDDMIDVDLDAVRANPAAAATLPPAALVRALGAAADRIAELEAVAREAAERESAMREELGQVQEHTAYARGRMEMLEEVIAALHANLEDLRYERARNRAVEAPAQRALRPGDRSHDTFGMDGAFK